MGKRPPSTVTIATGALPAYSFSLGGIVVAAFVQLWKRSRTAGVVAILVVVALVAVMVTEALKAEKRYALEAERKRLESATYTRQLENLQAAQTSLTQLMSFVEAQKSSIKATQDALEAKQAELQRTDAERAKLQKIAEAHREVIVGVLSVQQDQQKNTVWTERAFGFVGGIVASLFASILIAGWKLLWVRIREGKGAS
ncbi:TPA: hypothetical protein ACGCGR_000632 [Stenotrophomonas maltophilia]